MSLKSEHITTRLNSEQVKEGKKHAEEFSFKSFNAYLNGALEHYNRRYAGKKNKKQN